MEPLAPRTTHLEAWQLEALRRGTLDDAEIRRVRSHLAEACAGCARTVAEVLVDRYGDLPRPVDPAGSRRAGAIPLPAAPFVRYHVEAAAWEEAVAPGLARALEPWEEAEAFRLIGEEPAYRTHALATHLSEKCRRVVILDTRRGYHLGRLAVAVAAHAPEERYGSGLCADLRGEAALALANAARCCSRLYEARRALEMAEEFLEEGTGCPSMSFRLVNDRSSLVRALGYRQEALRMYEAELRMAREGSPHLRRARRNIGIRVKRVILLSELDPARALRLQRSLLGRLRERELSWLAYCAQTCIVDCLLYTGRSAEAHRELKTLEREFRRFASTRHHMTILRQKTSIFRALGRFDEAWKILEELRRSYISSDPTLESAHVTAELAAMAFGLGRATEARRYAAEASSHYSWMGAALHARQTAKLLVRH